MSGRHGMSKSDSSRIQSSQAKGGGDMTSGGFAARAQSAADRGAAAQPSSGSQGDRSSGSMNQPSGASGASSGAKK